MGKQCLPAADQCSVASLSPDLIAVAFQEIVPLNAQQIVQTDPSKLYASAPSLLLCFWTVG